MGLARGRYRFVEGLLPWVAGAGRGPPAARGLILNRAALGSGPFRARADEPVAREPSPCAPPRSRYFGPLQNRPAPPRGHSAAGNAGAPLPARELVPEIDEVIHSVHGLDRSTT